MKNNNKWLISTAVTLATGILLGWIIFGSNTSITPTVQSSGHVHPHESDHQAIWTCSMHPQIRQDEPGDCPICGMDLIPLDENASNDPLVLEMTAEAVKLANIQTTVIGGKATTSAATQTLRLSGKIQADERRAASQVAHVQGRIEKLYVSFTGEQVRKGQRLADLYAPELITAQQELLEAKRIADINPELLATARDKLRYWKVPEATITAIESGGQLKEIFPLYADASGIVTERKVAVGDYVKRGEVLFNMVNLSRVWGVFDAYEEDLADIKLGSTLSFTTPALPERTFTAKVSFIDPVINPKTRVASIRVAVDNTGGRLKPEMLVTGTLESTIADTLALTVPKSAVLWTGTRSVVYVSVPDTNVPNFQYREVKLGERRGDAYEVLAGLAPGEEVVTYGNFALDAAAQLNNQASMMNQNVALKGGAFSKELPDYTSTTPAAFKAQLQTVTNAYLSVKDALVIGDASAAVTAVDPLLSQLESVNMSLLEGEAHRYWMRQYEAIASHTTAIKEAVNELAQQREQFDFLSQALINSLRVFGVSEGIYYVQHCPMAFNDEGADWLSDEKMILNPYFGDEMLHCGIVEQELGE